MTATTITAEQIATLAAAGDPYWFVRADGSLYAAAEQTPDDAGDIYVLRASAAWLAQWDGDYQAAADQINSVLTKQEDGG